MKEKLLIASGCSYTDQDYETYISNDIMVWPELVAAELGIEHLNLGAQGASNDYICNSVTDAIFDYSDRDLIVMVLWTSSNRWYPCPGKDTLVKEDWLVTYQLRCMWRLNEFCKQQQVSLYQGHSTCPLADLGFVSYDPLLKNRYYNPEYFGPQNPISNMPWMANEPYMIPGDGHPNQKGHDWIAEYFLIRYEGGDFDVPLHNSKYIEFVYE